MTRRTMALLALLIASVAAPVHAQCPCGNTSKQEYGDAMYRHLNIWPAVLDYNHVGVFAGLRPSDGLGRVMHAVNPSTTTREDDAREITQYNGTYYGAYTLNNFTLAFTGRRNIVSVAKQMVDAQIGYEWNDALDYSGLSFDGSIADINNIRCDGFVEYAYEKNSISAWSIKSRPAEWSIVTYPDHHNNAPDLTKNPDTECSPWAQRGAPGYSGTNPNNTTLTLASTIVVPTYQVTQRAGTGGSVIVTIRATDTSGVHQIGYKLGSGAWQYSSRNVQHPSSDTYSTDVTVTASNTLYYYAIDNGGNQPQTAQSVWVEVGQACTDSYEPNNSSGASYGPIAPSTTYSGKICDSSDVDWFKFTLNNGQTATFTVSVPSANNFDIEMYNPGGSWVKGSYNGTGAAETLTYTASSSGTHYVRVYGVSGSYSTTSSYGLSFTIQGQSCTYTRSPATATGAGAGGTGTIEVVGSPSGCTGSWSASSSSFITLTGTASGNGASTWQVPYSYPQNPSTTNSRQGTVAFNGSFPSGSTFTLTQDPAPVQSCTYAISPQSASGAGTGGTGTIQVVGSPSGCTGSWSASSSSFITLTGTTGGNGASTWQVPYSYPQNPSTTNSRQGTVAFNGSFPSGGTFTLTQDPAPVQSCTYSLSPQSASGAGAGGTGVIQVVGSPSGCTGSWSASSSSFITLTGTTGGNGASTWQVPYSYPQNPSATNSRQGTVAFNGAFPSGGTFTLTQDPSSVLSCTYALSPASADGAGAGGSGVIQVVGSPNGCTGSWSATSNSFLALTGTTSGSGASTWQVPYSYPQNPSATTARQGTVAFTGVFPGGATFTLTQGPYAANDLPNLTPYKPFGWSDKIVISRVEGTTTDDALTGSDPLYLDWAVLNDGPVAAPAGFYIDIVIDGEVVAYWYTGSTLDPNYYFYWFDWAGAALAPGTHTITVIADSLNAVTESNESDNAYTKTIQVRANAGRTRGDFNGDGHADFGVFRPSTGMWYGTALQPTRWGQIGDVPVPADYNGDGREDVAVFRPSTGTWYSNVFNPTVWGQSGDIALPADYDGDGDDDVAVFRPATGMWYSGAFNPTAWGQNGDIPVPADYNGDGRAEIAVFRPATGVWYSNAFNPTVWGQNGDVPVPADYNGDGRDEIAVFRPSTGMWYSNAFNPTQWGQIGDVPVPADYDGDGDDDIAVFRPSTGMWYSLAFNPTKWGENGDFALTSIAGTRKY